MQSIDKTIESFFRANEKSLENNYPGINQRIICETFIDLLGVKIDLKTLPSSQEESVLDIFFKNS